MRVDNCTIDLRKCPYTNVSIQKLTNSVIYTYTQSANWSPEGYYLRLYDVIQNNIFVDSKIYEFIFSGCIALEGVSLFENNAFISDFIPSQLTNVFSIDAEQYRSLGNQTNYYWSVFKEYGNRLIKNNIDGNGNVKLDYSNSDLFEPCLVNPFITNIELLNADGDVINTVGAEVAKAKVTFSKEMDENSEFELYYGSWYPYSDYLISGTFVSETVWEGSFQVKATIEGGIQNFSSKGGYAKNNPSDYLVDNSGSFTFSIDTSSAMSMNLQAVATDQGVELTWVQDDYDTLMGYNVYRSEDKDGNFVRINGSIIPSGENTFFDDSCEPGKTYWYTFTVILSDFNESTPTGKVMATPIDTIVPTIYHTPVNQAYQSNNLIISCIASDNIAVTSVTLYYRAIGDSTWKTLTMTKENDRFSTVIFGSEVTMSGLEYYISATDGRNIITRGSADNPYQVLVKDASLLSRTGDVDGDGTVTTRDALMIMQAINGDLLLSDDQFQRADLNKDGILSSMEALRILQYINGNVSTLEM